MEFYNKHYITVDNHNRIVNGFSDAFRQPSDTDICINEQGGYQFRLIYAEFDPNSEIMAVHKQSEENPNLFEWQHMIPLYRWDAAVKQVVNRTEEEIEADIAALPVPEYKPTAEERIADLEAINAELEDAMCEMDASNQEDIAALNETVSALEDAVCEMDAANEERMAAIEDALCEIDMG